MYSKTTKKKEAEKMKMNNTIEEVWKDVVGFEGIYKVSSLGNVARVKGEKLR